MQNREVLSMQNITKRFGGVVALAGVNFGCEEGEIHALVGENGAGKSTLMNILGGLLSPEEGDILFDGKPVQLHSPMDAFSRGIGFVHQESNLLENLSVRENIFLAYETRKKGFLLDEAEMDRAVEATNQRLGYTLPPGQKVGALKLADRQLVEISRALLHNPRIVIMDEPTSALSEDEVQRLFAILRRLQQQKVCIIYISHRLDEIVELASRVTVLKDGKNAGELTKEQLTKEAMISLMIGRTLHDIYPQRAGHCPGETLLRVEDLHIPGAVHGVSFAVKAGEILGLGGLEGHGQREVARALFGETAYSRGHVEMDGIVFGPKNNSIAKHIRGRIGYLTHDRHGEGLILHQALRKNASLAALKHFSGPLGWVKLAKEKQEVQAVFEDLQVKAETMEQAVASLSGGNQQKIMLARWLLASPRLLIIDEPTKGVDVGARTSLYHMIDKLTKQGIAVVLLTSDMMELLGLSDRTLVFYEGRISAQFGREEASETAVMQAASGLLGKGGEAG